MSQVRGVGRSTDFEGDWLTQAGFKGPPTRALTAFPQPEMLYSSGPGSEIDVANGTHRAGKEGLDKAFPAHPRQVPVKLGPVNVHSRLAGEAVPAEITKKLISL